MTKKVTAYEAVHLSVNCKKNDSVDFKAGGPLYLGFDFYVDPNHYKALTEHVKKELKANSVPWINIQYSRDVTVKKLWTKQMVTAEIARCANQY